MIFNPNYTWPKWVGQVIGTLTQFAVGYVSVMEAAKEPWFSWTAVAAGLGMALSFNHGVYTTPSSNGK